MARLLAFKHAMDQIYGPFATISDPEHWEPPLNSGGHRGRYLWTDAFGVLNFLTLHHESMRERPTSESTPYLKMAERLVSSVHDILGYTRDGSTRLPGATDTEPLKGGLRIGKNDAEGPDCDGQYHHYLSLWMFALNRLSLVTKNHYYNDQAVSLARAIHPRFFVKRENSEPRMVWKLSIDLTKVLVNSEGNLDAIEGYVIYRILQATARYQHVEEPKVRGLEEEINDYRRVMQRKGNHLVTSDALDLGMTMWTTHWFTGKEIWAKQLMQACQEKASKYFRCLIEVTCIGRPRETSQNLTFSRSALQPIQIFSPTT